MDLVIAIRQAWNATIDLLDGLDGAAWQSATGCDGWSVHDVAAHLGHLEGVGHGYPQPPVPSDFDPSGLSPLDAVTEAGVAARRAWPDRQVLDEMRQAATDTLELIAGLDEEAWQQPAPSPVGMMPRHQAQELRLADLWVHLLDIRWGLGMPLDPNTEPSAAEAVIARSIRLAPWGAVKRAGLDDGTRIRLDITGPGGFDCTLAVAGGRGTLLEADATLTDAIRGPGTAFLLAAGGRTHMVEAAGGLAVTGPAAERFAARYRIFA